jgi:protein CpxP
MKKIILVCCFVIAATTMSFAQNSTGQRMTAEEQAKMMQTPLKLSDDQTTKLTAIFQRFSDQRDSLTKANNGDVAAVRAALAPIHEATEKQIKAFLTEEQKVEFDKFMAAIHAGPPPAPSEN